MKYIVFWIVLLTTPAPCPDIQMDQVTGLPSGVGLNCGVYHTKTDTIYREEVFTNLAEMNSFVVEMLNQDIRIDSFSVTEIRETVIYEYKFTTDSTAFNYKQDSITIHQSTDWIKKN
jgi:hypothetical protein